MRVAVLGLGPSLSLYKRGEFDRVVGVNNIFSRHFVDDLVIVDPPNRFPGPRIKQIMSSTPFCTYSQYNEFRQVPSDLFHEIKFHPVRGSVDSLGDWNQIPKSNNSTFVAVCIAYLLGANSITMFGADFIDHPNFKGYLLKQTIRDFETLSLALKKRGVDFHILNPQSPLARVIPCK